ncbi:cyclic nucleotide-binding domain-containing protein [Stappia sp. GBMRC 2046]|uniref:Cyclic nucleotide-binding domain-containing protein n=1 Tax=Stappia sediminis TaxID=2692190 RepID=A0A7X3LRH0_9HYPH|nr:cyclic nucleotide-gated ion channel [Stappia sediminis]MXN63746.1 cyclic nucleotide-binding domain-containing protein [Stappia sediminis]
MTEGFKTTAYRLLEKGVTGDPLGRRVNRVLVLFILATVVVALLETVPEVSARYSRLFALAELATGLVFLTEYLARLWVADLHPPLRRFGPIGARFRYALQPEAIIDFLAVLPFVVGLFVSDAAFKAFVIVRLVRFLKLARYSPALRSLINAVAQERHALIASFVIIFGAVLVAATGMYLVERHVQPEKFGSIPAAMWWALATLTTVGYGDVVPVTATGKVLGGLVMMMGYGLFALPIGIVATAFAREIHSREFVVTWAMVARVPLFEDLRATEIADIAKLLRAVTIGAGEIVTEKGEDADCMYFIANGAVEADFGHSRLQLGEGAFFGEMAMVGPRKRAATVTALERTDLMALSASDLGVLMQRRPVLAERILKEAEERAATTFYPDIDIAEEELEQEEAALSETVADSGEGSEEEPELFTEAASDTEGSSERS